VLRPHRPASPPPQAQDIPDSEPPRESVAPGRGARQQRVHRNDERHTTRWRRYTSYKVANMLVEFSTSIPRTQLRPGYGDGFLGAPLHTVRPPVKPSPREQGGRRGTSRPQTQPTPGSAHHV